MPSTTWCETEVRKPPLCFSTTLLHRSQRELITLTATLAQCFIIICFYSVLRFTPPTSPLPYHAPHRGHRSFILGYEQGNSQRYFFTHSRRSFSSYFLLSIECSFSSSSSYTFVSLFFVSSLSSWSLSSSSSFFWNLYYVPTRLRLVRYISCPLALPYPVAVRNIHNVRVKNRYDMGSRFRKVEEHSAVNVEIEIGRWLNPARSRKS